MPVEIVVPRMGLTQTDGTVVRWLKREGDAVAKGEPILELMTDKAVIEVEAPASGVMGQILHEADAVVPIGQPLAYIIQPGENLAAQALGAKSAPPRITPLAGRIAQEHGLDVRDIKGTGPGGAVTKEDVLARVAAAPAAPPEGHRASPAARRAARELGIDLVTLKGTGPGGRITEEDVDKAAQAGKLQRAPAVETKAPVDGEIPVLAVEPLRGIRQITAERMTVSFQATPHFYLTVELDASAMLALRDRLNSADSIKITVTDLLVKFAAITLKEHTYANTSFKDGSIRKYGQVNIGIAAATDKGLVVPVIKEADGKNLWSIAHEREELTGRAREGRLTMEDLSGGTFTISNLGMYGVDLFAGIINPPQSALLAVGRIRERPYVSNGRLDVRPTFFATLSVDHRVMDGAQAALWLQRLSAFIEQPALLVA